MKRFFVLLLALCLLLPVCGTAETETQAEQETAQEISLHDVRYYYEHRLMRDFFFADPEECLIKVQGFKPSYFWSWWTEQISFDMTYQESDFSVRRLERDGIRMVILEMPEPEQMPDCSRIWMCFERETGNGRYFTVEYDDFMGVTWFLCEWVKTGEGDEDWKHMNYGTFEAADSSAEDYEAQLEAEADLIAGIIRASAQ